MPKSDEKVMALVEKELKRKPDASVNELYEKAKAAQPSVGQLSYRQFNARYPLQVKRRKSQSSPGNRRGSTRRAARRSTLPSHAGDSQREKVRAIFLAFATDVVSADDRKELVRVLATVDEYVARVLATGA
jgi:hypothetical protein